MNTAVFYRGPSQLNGDPIVGVLTGLSTHPSQQSNNPKTGPMVQAYIQREDMSPREAIETGADAAMCGDCALRGDGVHGRGCYVTWWQAPRKIYESMPKREFVDPWTLRDELRGRWIRLGAYGDPVAIPIVTWSNLLSRSAGWIGYTQQWRTCDPAYKFFVMASCLSSVAQEEAAMMGWRTYRIRGPKDPLQPHEVICPASHEAGQKLTCQECTLCQGSGARGASRPHAAIIAHGKPGNLAAFGMKPAPYQHSVKWLGSHRA